MMARKPQPAMTQMASIAPSSARDVVVREASNQSTPIMEVAKKCPSVTGRRSTTANGTPPTNATLATIRTRKPNDRRKTILPRRARRSRTKSRPPEVSSPRSSPETLEDADTAGASVSVMVVEESYGRFIGSSLRTIAQLYHSRAESMDDYELAPWPARIRLQHVTPPSALASSEASTRSSVISRLRRRSAVRTNALG